MKEKGIINQRICKVLVEDNVITNQTMLVNHLFSINAVSIDDIEKNRDNERIEEIKERLEEIEGLIWFFTEKTDNISDSEAHIKANIRFCALQQKISKLEDEEIELEEELRELEDEKDILEWWVVSSFLESRLRAKGESFLVTDFETWWGRGCTGQGIALDGTIVEIAKDMEILYGQKNHESWAKRI